MESRPEQTPQTDPRRLSLTEALEQAIAHHKAGRLPDAERLYRAILRAQPRHPDANHNLGVLAVGVGKPDAALPFFRAALETNPEPAQYWLSYVHALLAGRDLKSAQEAIDSAEKRGLSPQLFEELKRKLSGASQTGPDRAEEQQLATLFNQGRFAEAEELARTMTRRFPDHGFGWNVLGAVLNKCGRNEDALAAAQRAASLLPNVAGAHHNLGVILKKSGRLEEAEASCRRAIAINPQHVDAHLNLGNTLLALERLQEAEATYRRTIALKPDHIDAHNNLGGTLLRAGRLTEAEGFQRRVLEIDPHYAEAHNNLSMIFATLGRVEEAVACGRRALEARPDYADAHSNLLFCLHYVPQVSPAELYAEHRRWEEQQTKPGVGTAPGVTNQDPHRRLRVGYVSPDLVQHSVAYFFEPLLRAHDRSAFEIFCYAEVAQPDAVTARLQGLADRWLRTVGWPDQALARRIADDEIDILVDLAGHTAHNRLAAFALKPAPIQVTWLGYPNTTGLRAMDYRLVDEVTDPTGIADALATEHLVRLENGFLCYAAPATAPQPAAPPSAASGTITFGSFNNLAKLSPIVLDAWAALLRRVPDSQLLLKGLIFKEASSRTAFLARLQRHGIDAQRVTLCERTPGLEDHLAEYGQMDIALDPFPYNGTTTTCEAMWMGVPVVTLRGDRHAGRVGASLLTRVGLTELVADSVEAYVEIAVALARDSQRLIAFRHTLRERMARSSLCDAPGFARKIEVAYRHMWQTFCDGPHRLRGNT